MRRPPTVVAGTALEQFAAREEERDLDRSRSRRSPMPWMAFCSIDSPKSLRIVPASAFAGSVAPMSLRSCGNGVVALQRGDVDRAGRHVLDEVREERALAVDGVEALGLALRERDLLQAEDPESLGFEAADDLAEISFADRVRLDDRECAV